MYELASYDYQLRERESSQLVPPVQVAEFPEGCENYFLLWLRSCLECSFHQICNPHKYMSSLLFFFWIVCSLSKAGIHLIASKFLDCHLVTDPLQILVYKMRVTKQLVTQFPVLSSPFQLLRVSTRRCLVWCGHFKNILCRKKEYSHYTRTWASFYKW